MKKRTNARLQKRQHVSSATTARRQCRPKTFVPFVADIAPNTLRHHSIHDQRTNILFRNVVRRSNPRRIIDEQKITFAVFFKTFHQIRRSLVLRNKTTNRFPNRFFVTIHQPFETDFRQRRLTMNRDEHRFNVPKQTFSVRLGVVKRRQELDFADQVRPTELKERFRLFFVLQVSGEKVTADTATKILAERLVQDLAAPRGVDLEKRQ
jgi:hypothetical protein